MQSEWVQFHMVVLTSEKGFGSDIMREGFLEGRGGIRYEKGQWFKITYFRSWEKKCNSFNTHFCLFPKDYQLYFFSFNSISYSITRYIQGIPKKLIKDQYNEKANFSQRLNCQKFVMQIYHPPKTIILFSRNRLCINSIM